MEASMIRQALVVLFCVLLFALSQQSGSVSMVEISLKPITSTQLLNLNEGNFEGEFLVSGGDSLHIRIMPFDSGNWFITLPSGNIVNENNLSSYSATFEIDEQNPGNPFSPARSLNIFLSSPPVGNYKMTIQGVSPNSKLVLQTTVLGSGILSALLAGSPSGTLRAFATNQAIPLYLYVFSGSTLIQNIQAQAQIFLLNGQIETLVGQTNFTLAGGAYMANFTPQLVGSYIVRVRAIGVNASNQAFSVDEQVSLLVKEDDITLTGAFQDEAVDAIRTGIGSNGYLDGVQITFSSAGTRRQGTYWLTVVLEGSNGRQLQVENRIEGNDPLRVIVPFRSVDQFANTLPDFPDSLEKLGVNGPYKVVDVRLFGGVTPESLPADFLDQRENLGQTQPYDLNAVNWERDNTQVTRIISSQGVDTNNNGRFDRLDVNIEISAINLGNNQGRQDYGISAELQAFDGTPIDIASHPIAWLTSGVGNFTLSFSGYSIGIMAKDGPYRVANILVYPRFPGAKNSDTAVIELLGQTQSYLSGQFEGSQISQPVRPILECVRPNTDGSFTAFFGYRNDNTIAVTTPIGQANRFTPNPQDRGQPVVFQPGRTPFYPNAAFAVRFDGNNLVWTLRGRTSTASRNSARCP